MLKYILLLPVVTIVFNSCFTSNLLKDENNISAIPADSYTFNRAYYSSDSILHIDFNNDDSHRKKTTYYGISININAILKEYYKEGGDIVYFKHKITRRYKAISAGTVLKNCSCVETYHYRDAVVIDFKDIKVNYLRELPTINDSSLIKKTDIMAASCCGWPQADGNNTDEANWLPVNTPATIYFMPANIAGGFVALRFPLKNHKTKASLLPLTLLADIVTSPIQLVWALVENKLNGDDSNSTNNNVSSNTTNSNTKTTNQNHKSKKIH